MEEVDGSSKSEESITRGLNPGGISQETPLLGPPDRAWHCERKGLGDKGIQPRFSLTKKPQYFYSAENGIILLGLL